MSKLDKIEKVIAFVGGIFELTLYALLIVIIIGLYDFFYDLGEAYDKTKGQLIELYEEAERELKEL